ncbi:MAG: L,D-transpeptidase [Eubacteriales bacterium]|nr:L,D-transpeptidase [Eubacteriales bacterium]MDD3882693.1 L,D-transpeptidase [Eubacteriales bacterium]MDD4512735.1 L,D-transpeptidase [Eubacteriales bacterium]
MRKLTGAILAIVILLLCPAALGEGDPFFTSYDITDTEAVWERLMEEITVLDAGGKDKIYPLDAPGGNKIFDDKLGGYIYGESAAVKVLSDDKDGWTLIQAYDDHDRLLTGYVKTNLLKKVKPRSDYGIVIDKLTQRLYIFKEGEYFSELAISTGLVNDKQPYNETASGEFMLVSWTGGFWSGNMFCAMGIRFNGGDLIHEVPHFVASDGGKNYKAFEPLLGTRASHGCVRVQRRKNNDGVNMTWIWNNLKKKTKVLVWDDDGRTLEYPSDDFTLYWNPNGGTSYHSVDDCRGVKDKYLPLTAFTYGELETAPYKKLSECPYCIPVKRKSVIDEQNALRVPAPQAETSEQADETETDTQTVEGETDGE